MLICHLMNLYFAGVPVEILCALAGHVECFIYKKVGHFEEGN